MSGDIITVKTKKNLLASSKTGVFEKEKFHVLICRINIGLSKAKPKLYYNILAFFFLVYQNSDS